MNTIPFFAAKFPTKYQLETMFELHENNNKSSIYLKNFIKNVNKMPTETDKQRRDKLNSYNEYIILLEVHKRSQSSPSFCNIVAKICSNNYVDDILISLEDLEDCMLDEILNEILNDIPIEL